MNKGLIKGFTVSRLQAPLDQPFRTALGEHRFLENVLFGLKLNDGTKGYGEAAIAKHITGESLKVTFDNLQKLGRSLIGKNVSDYVNISHGAHERLPHNKAAVAAIESALLDAMTRQLKIPLWRFFGKTCRRIQSDITIVIADLQETTESVTRFYRNGFRSFKVKIGCDEKLDYERVLAVHTITKGCPIYLDANQGYNAQQTLKFLRLLKGKKILPALIEQPVAKHDWEGLKRVARLAGVPVCADESDRSFSDARRLIKEKSCQAINIKFTKCGILQARDIVALARSSGMKLMMGGMMETSLSMTASAHFASALGCFDYIDLDTPFFIKKGHDTNPFLNSRGVYDLKGVKAGIGIYPQRKNIFRDR